MNDALRRLREINAPQWWKDSWQVPPRKMRLRDWAEAHILIPKSSRPGPFRLENNPIQGPILDVMDHPDVRETAMLKGVQAAGTQTAKIFLGHKAHVEGKTYAMLVLPSRDSGQGIMTKMYRPLLSGSECPPLKQYQRKRRPRSRRKNDKDEEDVERTKRNNIILTNGFDLLLGYSGSATSLASYPCKYVLLDETDKFNDWETDEAGPIDLARARVETYLDTYKVVALSTPTVEKGQIYQLFLASTIKLYPFIACPKCGQPVQLMFENIRWEPFPKDLVDEQERADLLLAEPHRVWIECDGCHYHISEEQRRALIQRVWLGTQKQDWQLHADGREVGKKPPGKRVGIHLPTVASLLGAGIVEQAANWVAAQGKIEKIRDCKNKHHAMPFRFDVGKPAKGLLKKKCEDDEDRGFKAPEWGKVPTWGAKLVMTVDTQKNKFYWVIRAWGARMRSRLVACGEALNFEQIEELLDRTYWPNEDPKLPARRASICAIDSGGGIDRQDEDANRTVQVYRWCARDVSRRVALKGIRSKKYDGAMTRLMPHKYQNDQTGEVINFHLLWVNPLDTGDVLGNMQQAQLEVVDPKTGEITEFKVDQWELNRKTPNDYIRHHEVMARLTIKKKTKILIVWGPEIEGARHDYHDLERYQVAVAHTPEMGCAGLPSEEQIRADIAKRTAVQATPNQGGIKTADGRDFLASQR